MPGSFVISQYELCCSDDSALFLLRNRLRFEAIGRWWLAIAGTWRVLNGSWVHENMQRNRWWVRGKAVATIQPPPRMNSNHPDANNN